jgi:hypothetical protein
MKDDLTIADGMQFCHDYPGTADVILDWLSHPEQRNLLADAWGHDVAEWLVRYATKLRAENACQETEIAALLAHNDRLKADLTEALEAVEEARARGEQQTRRVLSTAAGDEVYIGIKGRSGTPAEKQGERGHA